MVQGLQHAQQQHALQGAVRPQLPPSALHMNRAEVGGLKQLNVNATNSEWEWVHSKVQAKAN